MGRTRISPVTFWGSNSRWKMGNCVLSPGMENSADGLTKVLRLLGPGALHPGILRPMRGISSKDGGGMQFSFVPPCFFHQRTANICTSTSIEFIMPLVAGRQRGVFSRFVFFPFTRKIAQTICMAPQQIPALLRGNQLGIRTWEDVLGSVETSLGT